MRRTEANKAFNQRQEAVLEIVVLHVSDHNEVRLSHTALGDNDEGGSEGNLRTERELF